LNWNRIVTVCYEDSGHYMAKACVDLCHQCLWSCEALVALVSSLRALITLIRWILATDLPSMWRLREGVVSVINATSQNDHTCGWSKYSRLVLCKFWGNSGVTASALHHWKPQESSMWRWFHIAGKCNTRQGVAFPGCGGGPWSRGSALLVFGSSVLVSILLCSLSMSGSALSTRVMGALRFRGSCSWLGERKGSWTVGYLLVFLSRMCCHKASWAVVRLVAFQGVRRKHCMLLPFGGNF